MYLRTVVESELSATRAARLSPLKRRPQLFLRVGGGRSKKWFCLLFIKWNIDELKHTCIIHLHLCRSVALIVS